MAVTRLSGLTSGLDVDSIVKKLMEAQQTKLDKLNQQKTKMEWKQEDYRTLTTSIVDFRNNKLSTYSKSTALSAKTTAVTGNTTAVTATASSTATGSLAVRVDQLATSGNLQLSTGVKSSTQTLGTSLGNTGYVEVNGVQISYDGSSDTMSSLVTKINSNTSAGVTAIYDSTSGKLSISSNSTGTSVSVGGDLKGLSSNATGVSLDTGISSSDSSKTLGDLKSAGTISYSSNTVSINGTSISFDDTDTVASLVSKINASSAGVTAGFSSSTGELTINNTDTSSTTAVSLSGDLFTNSNGFKQDGLSAAGKVAKVNVNGMDMEYSSNNFTVNGVSVTLNSVSGTGGVTNINVKSDTSSILSTIKSFISDYNTLIDKVNSELDESVYRSYTPLTDTQKESMTDDQIALWETKAKSGSLRNDTTLSKMVSDLRMTSLASVTTSDGTTLNLQTLGITTGTYSEKGKLVIQDEDKLTAAIEANPDRVAELFGKTSSDTSASSTSSGVFTRMSKIANTALTSLYSSVGTSTTSTSTNTDFASNSELSRQITAMTDKISDFKEFMTRIENSYYTKFTAMESAVSKYNSMSTSLSSYSG
ncbi:flagellar filament capping protein FliD [Paenibacillus sp. WLX1005]|uniref:flagellar filament capping protein FliD n=1 Tax=Paenibacillus sp. WLX1005 TaxID=3243766 RepID=UPI0039844929